MHGGLTRAVIWRAIVFVYLCICLHMGICICVYMQLDPFVWRLGVMTQELLSGVR